LTISTVDEARKWKAGCNFYNFVAKNKNSIFLVYRKILLKMRRMIHRKYLQKIEENLRGSS